MADTVETKTCEGCSATIYPEHLERGGAGYHLGKVYCNVCMKEKKEETSHRELTPAEKAIIAMEQRDQQKKEIEKEEHALSVVSDEEMETSPKRKIQAFGGSSSSLVDDTEFKRPLNLTGQGATRCRIFHTRMNDGAAAHMGRMINEWADSREDIEIKYISTTVGVWEGKRPEPHLILTVLY